MWLMPGSSWGVFSLPQILSDNAHLPLFSTFPRPGFNHAAIPEVLRKVVCILEILFPAVRLENTSQASRVCSYEIKILVPTEDANFPVQMSKYTFSFCFLQMATCLKLQEHAEC